MRKWMYSSTVLSLGTRLRSAVSFTPLPTPPPRGKEPHTYFKGGWVGPRHGIDVMQTRKMTCSYRESNPDSSIVQPVR
jgi:hypothetical protein